MILGKYYWRENSFMYILTTYKNYEVNRARTHVKRSCTPPNKINSHMGVAAPGLIKLRVKQY